MYKNSAIVGQGQLIDNLTRLISRGCLPRMILFTGPKGQGKRTISKWVAEALGAPLYVPESVKIDDIRTIIEDSQTLSNPKVYLLADVGSTMTLQAQNALLKLSEEPPKNAYIIMTVEDVSSLLPTIISRSVVFRLANYSRQELEQFTEDKELAKVAQNPGMIKHLEQLGYKELLELARKVVSSISKVSAFNVFRILRAVDKEHYLTFVDLLLYAYEELIDNGASRIEQVKVVSRTLDKLRANKSLNVQNALEMMFVELREVAIREVQST